MIMCNLELVLELLDEYLPVETKVELKCVSKALNETISLARHIFISTAINNKNRTITTLDNLSNAFTQVSNLSVLGKLFIFEANNTNGAGVVPNDTIFFDAFTKLKNLQQLSLQNIRAVNDADFSHIGKLSTLVSLNLKHLHEITLQGLQHLSNLNLVSLSIESCRSVTGTGIFPILGRMISLRSLSLIGLTVFGNNNNDGNNVNVEDRNNIAHFSNLANNLDTLDLSKSSPCKTTFEQIGKLTSLTYLNMYNTDTLDDDNFKQLSDLKDLVYLCTENISCLSETSLYVLQNFRQLRTLHLGRAFSTFYPIYTPTPTLVYLNLHYHTLTVNLFENLAKCFNLQQLILVRCIFEDALKSKKRLFSNFKNLHTLILRSPSTLPEYFISDLVSPTESIETQKPYEFLESTTQLECLDSSSNSLILHGAASPQPITSKLYELEIQHNNLEAKDLLLLKTLPYLHILHLEGSAKLNDADLDILGDMPYLTNLTIKRCSKITRDFASLKTNGKYQSLQSFKKDY